MKSHGDGIVGAVEGLKRNVRLVEDAHNPQRLVELGRRVVDPEARDNLAKGQGRIGHADTVLALYVTYNAVEVAARYVPNFGENRLAGAASIGKDHDGPKPGTVIGS